MAIELHKAMNIVLVNVWLDPERGAGTAERTRHLARHLKDLGCTCSIVTMDGATRIAELAAAGIQVRSVRYWGRRFPIPLIRPLELWRAVREADVVHVMGYWYLLAFAVYLFARLVRKPVVICPAGELSPFECRPLRKRLYHRLVGRRMLVGAACIIATTEDERGYIKTGMGATIARIIISPNGISPPTAPDNNWPWPSVPAPFVLFLGRLTAIKGPDLLVEAFAQICKELPDVHLVIAGPDLGMRPGLEVRVRDLGLGNRVHFFGFVDEGRRWHLYRQATVLAVPSRSEVMSMVALEAAAMGLPVILTDRCGFPEVAESGGGLVVPPDPAALAKGLRSMFADPAALAPMGVRLRQFVLNRYAWPIVAQELLEHLLTLKRL